MILRLAHLLIGLATVTVGVLPPLQADCNLNGLSDLEDISSGRSRDCNANQIPDECERAPLALGAEITSYDEITTHALAVGDFDNDGLTDVAAGLSETTGPPGVTVFLNRGERRFESVSLIVPESLTDLEVLDLDADGDLDLVGVSSNGFYRMENLGGGSFGDPVGTEMGRTLVFLKAVDLDGDELLDIVIADSRDDTLITLRNDGAGGFETPETHPVGDAPRWILPLDIDLDSDVDLITANRISRDLTLHFNDGKGGFPSSETLDLPEKPYALTVLDFDGDGSEELVVAANRTLFLLERQEGRLALSLSIPLGI